MSRVSLAEEEGELIINCRTQISHESVTYPSLTVLTTSMHIDGRFFGRIFGVKLAGESGEDGFQ
jgi:hypothetical protein